MNIQQGIRRFREAWVPQVPGPRGQVFVRGMEIPILGPGLPLLLLACISFSGCHSEPPLTPQQTEGQHLYQSRCAHCHEENDLALKPPPPQIHGVLQKAKLPSGIDATDAVVRHQIIYGKNKMPSFSGRFTEEQMSALLAYLHTSMPNADGLAN